MEQRLNTQDVAAMDAQTLQSREECVLNKGQHGQRSDAAVMDAQIKLSVHKTWGKCQTTPRL